MESQNCSLANDSTTAEPLVKIKDSYAYLNQAKDLSSYEKQKRRESVLQLKLKIKSRNLLNSELKLPEIQQKETIKIHD